jgi:hypothetical protein
MREKQCSRLGRSLKAKQYLAGRGAPSPVGAGFLFQPRDRDWVQRDQSVALFAEVLHPIHIRGSVYESGLGQLSNYGSRHIRHPPWPKPGCSALTPGNASARRTAHLEAFDLLLRRKRLEPGSGRFSPDPALVAREASCKGKAMGSVTVSRRVIYHWKFRARTCVAARRRTRGGKLRSARLRSVALRHR